MNAGNLGSNKPTRLSSKKYTLTRHMIYVLSSADFTVEGVYSTHDMIPGRSLAMAQIKTSNF